MNGAYKITQGYYVGVEQKLRDLVLLFVFGSVEMFFEAYRKLTNYDQTDRLLNKYQFQEKVDEE